MSDQPASGRHRDAAPEPGPTPRPADAPAGPPARSAPPAPAKLAGAKPAIAVALKHEPGELPRVIASGKGSLAEKILEIAFQAGIKVREDADLAQMLAAIEQNTPIPIACFEAVAEILNYLYRANATAAGTPPS